MEQTYWKKIEADTSCRENFRPRNEWLDRTTPRVNSTGTRRGSITYQQVFEEVDEAKLRSLNSGQVFEALKKMGFEVVSSQIESLIKKYDRDDDVQGESNGNSNDMIELHEFMNMTRDFALTTLDLRTHLRSMHREIYNAVKDKKPHSSSWIAEESNATDLNRDCNAETLVLKLFDFAARPEASEPGQVLDKDNCETWTLDKLEALSLADLRELDNDLIVNRDLHNVRYVLYGSARQSKERGNDGSGETVTRDEGRHGWTLHHFHQQPQAIRSKLSIDEVAALRLYTMSTFTLINRPLREGCSETKKHPLALVTYHLHSGLKKMRALNFQRVEKVFRPFCALPSLDIDMQLALFSCFPVAVLCAILCALIVPNPMYLQSAQQPNPPCTCYSPASSMSSPA